MTDWKSSLRYDPTAWLLENASASVREKLEAANPQMAAAIRPAEAENEIRRLAEAMRALSADRNELLTRISSIEQSLEDITGSINRQTAAASLPLPPSPDPVAAIPEELPPTPTWVATLPVIGGSAEADLFKPKIDLRGEFGVDVGSAINFDALRVLWNSTKGAARRPLPARRRARE